MSKTRYTFASSKTKTDMKKVTLTDFEIVLIKQSLENFNKFVENNEHWESSITPKEFVLKRIAELYDKINNAEKIK